MEERKDNQQNKQSHASQTEEARTGSQQNASKTQGGTTNMDSNNTAGGTTSPTERSAGISTKRNVTGNDYDGQAGT